MSFSSCCSFLSSQIIQRQHNNIQYPDSLYFSFLHDFIFTSVSLIFTFNFWLFETGFLGIFVLELTLYTRLSLNSQRSVCLCLPSAGIKDVCYHTLNSQKSVCLCLLGIGIKSVYHHTQLLFLFFFFFFKKDFNLSLHIFF